MSDNLDTNQASEGELKVLLESNGWKFYEELNGFRKESKYTIPMFSTDQQANYDELSAGNYYELKQVIQSAIRTEKLKLLAEIGEPKLEDAINEEKTPEGVKSAPKEPNDIFIILSPYFECKDCGELGCPYNPDVPAELAEAIDQYTKTMCERARQDELKQLWNSTQPDIVPDGIPANDMSEALHKRIEKLRSES